jgi:hypothetical protein
MNIPPRTRPAMLTSILALAICAAMGGRSIALVPETKTATVVTSRDANGNCKTTTTPRTSAKKSGPDIIRWVPRDDGKCLGNGREFEIVFKPRENPFDSKCDLRDERRVQCQLRGNVGLGTLKYSVKLVGTNWVEDPELEIAQ